MNVSELQLESRARARTAKERDAPIVALPSQFINLLESTCWIAYSTANWNPATDPELSEQSIRRDLQILRRTGFAGLVTYGATDLIAPLAQELGFAALLYGVWDPSSESELSQARRAAQYPVVAGFVVGNEGLDVRYDYQTLSRSIVALKRATSKPVTTTEEIDDYADPKVLRLGDWLFPNVHPFYHNITDPALAVRWTELRYDDLRKRARRLTLLKEVGLPSAGHPDASEARQASFYQMLSPRVKAVRFEAFDQPGKTHTPVEPFWGLFRHDRTPKEAASVACARGAPR